MTEQNQEGELPEHLAITMFESPSSFEFYKKRKDLVLMLANLQAELGIKIMTVYLLDTALKNEEFSASVSSIAEIAVALREFSENSRTRISAFGRWYDLPSEVVESIKGLITLTADRNELFLNLCINYDGRDEITDACRIISLKALSGKLEPSSITRDTIKENISSSYFPSPSLIIKNNPPEASALLLWDSPGAKIIFTGKEWANISRQDVLNALRFYGKLKSQSE